MKKFLAERRDQQEGAVLVIALVFVAFIGVISVALLDYATTNLMASEKYEDLRQRQFSADAVVDGAINAVRRDQNLADDPLCFRATVNGLDLRVDCLGPTTGTSTEVEFTACPYTAAMCSSTSVTILVAKAKYNRSVTPAAVRPTRWSVKR